MILSDTEEILVILAGAVILMAIIGSTIKDYRRMRWEAQKKIAQKERDEEYVRTLTKVIDEKNKALQDLLKKKKVE